MADPKTHRTKPPFSLQDSQNILAQAGVRLTDESELAALTDELNNLVFRHDLFLKAEPLLLLRDAPRKMEQGRKWLKRFSEWLAKDQGPKDTGRRTLDNVLQWWKSLDEDIFHNDLMFGDSDDGFLKENPEDLVMRMERLPKTLESVVNNRQEVLKIVVDMLVSVEQALEHYPLVKKTQMARLDFIRRLGTIHKRYTGAEKYTYYYDTRREPKEGSVTFEEPAHGGATFDFIMSIFDLLYRRNLLGFRLSPHTIFEDMEKALAQE